MRLYIKDPAGEYYPAHKEIVLDAAFAVMQSTLKRGKKIKSSRDAELAIQNKIGSKLHEVFCCLFLNANHEIIDFKEVFRGSIGFSVVYPREVVKEGLDCNAAAVILAHNHPSGQCTPSKQDIDLTIKLRDILAVVDIKVLDHLIVGDRVLSLADEGMVVF